MAASTDRPKQLIKYWLPVIIYAIFIFRVSAVPGQNIPRIFNNQDIVFHVIEYMIFAVLLHRALKADHPGWTNLKRFLWVFVIAILYAVGDEFHQSFIIQRTASISDVACDGVGILITKFFYR